MVRLTISYNNEHLKTYELDATSITVGRLPENTISIANMGLSRRHFRIERDSAHNYVLSDLNSLNGTFVNNNKVKSCQLTGGDIISVGKYALLFEGMDAMEQGPSETQNPVVANEESDDGTDEVPAHNDAPASAEQEILEEISESGTVTSRRETVTDLLTPNAVFIDTDKHVVYKLEKQVLVLGSSESDDIFVTGFMIGDGHVTVEKKEDGVWIRANKVMGKFKVNGQKVKQHRLEHKDRIEIGNSTFRFMENE